MGNMGKGELFSHRLLITSVNLCCRNGQALCMMNPEPSLPCRQSKLIPFVSRSLILNGHLAMRILPVLDVVSPGQSMEMFADPSSISHLTSVRSPYNPSRIPFAPLPEPSLT